MSQEIELIFTDIDCSVLDCKNELKDGFLNLMLLGINGAVKTADTFQERQQI